MIAFVLCTGLIAPDFILQLFTPSDKAILDSAAVITIYALFFSFFCKRQTHHNLYFVSIFYNGIYPITSCGLLWISY